MSGLRCFTAYDVRGRLNETFDAAIAGRIARGFAAELGGGCVVVARDVRASSEELAGAVVAALIDSGVEVLDLGLAGTEEMYFATGYFEAAGGICVTASHNPMDYNGMKLVQGGAAPLTSAQLAQIKARAEAEDFAPSAQGARRDISAQARAAYVARVLSFVDLSALRPLHILVNAGHGTAGPSFDAIAQELENRGAPLRFSKLFHAPDGSFPQGIPNPLLLENRPVTAAAVRAAGADFGVAWDGDFDRCFLFDAEGGFVDGEYVVGLLAQMFLQKEAGAVIVHDPRVVWNTQDTVARGGGRAVQSRTGHAFLKAMMRAQNAVYGGEMSAHHYFRDFYGCDSGMIPWLLIAELVSRRGALTDLVAGRKAAFPSSGEINFAQPDPRATLARLRAHYAPRALAIDETDGLSCDMGAWRFNLRGSNTEPLLRLNVETRGDAALLERAVAQMTALIKPD